MSLSSMGQLALTVKESLKSLTVDKNRENDGKALSIQTRYIDSVELSERAIQLSKQADTETAIEKKTETSLINNGQEVVPAANPLQDVFAKALALNALA
ncbi:MAG: hypothetical protein MAG551_02184 [Candidatus Scalindua arabica]|uniref:Uncharacterized protein n=1 Tax=Candidatus Scalindua arabica TaxID=1127984 RepID=A0A941W4G0_9BACT|nr:hypothetical protein [Candidatus Scalindua arabica]